MADLSGDFEFLVTTVRRSISQLRACTAAHAAPGGGRGQGLREHIDETLDAISNRVDASEARFKAAKEDLERNSLIDSMRLLNRHVTSMHEAAAWLGTVDDSPVHIGILYFVDEAAAAIIGVDADVIPVGDAAYQYATVSWPFARILARLKRKPMASSRPVILFFPPQEAQTVLLHALFAHELAHSAILKHKLVLQVLRKHLSEKTFRSDFARRVKWLERKRKLTTAEAQIELTNNLTSWTTEHLCDAIAIEYLGPSYLLAFAAVVLSTSWSEPNQTHPPTTLRIGAMLDQLRMRGWEPLLRSSIPRTNDWLAGIATLSKSHKPSSPLEQFLVDWSRKFAVQISATAASRLGSSAYSPRDFEIVRQEVVELLSRQILPSQLQDGSPTDRRTIFLASWLQVFDLFEDSPSSIAKGAANDEFQDFLGTAMEMSSVLETWKSL